MKTVYFFSATILFFSLSAPAYAYLDPVSITFVLQGIIGGIAAVLASFRSIRTKVIGFISNILKSKSDASNSND